MCHPPSFLVRHRSSECIRTGAQRRPGGIAAAINVEFFSACREREPAVARRTLAPALSSARTQLHGPLPLSSRQYIRFSGTYVLSRLHRSCILAYTFNRTKLAGNSAAKTDTDMLNTQNLFRILLTLFDNYRIKFLFIN